MNIQHWKKIRMVGFALLGMLIPVLAFAHASERAFVVALPLQYYYGTGAVVVFLTFTFMAFMRKSYQLPIRELYYWRTLPLSHLFGLVSFFSFILLLLVGFFGNSDPLGNLLVLTIWTGMWVFMPFTCLIFGNVWHFINPWRSPVILLRQKMGWANRKENKLDRWLDRLGYLPAVFGYLGFAWFEIVSLAPDDPENLAFAVLNYWVVIFLIALYRGEAWLERGEFLTVFFGFIGRIAPLWLEWRDGKTALKLGFLGTRILQMPSLPKSGIAFLILTLSAVSYDGLVETFFWLDLHGINPLAFEGRSSVWGVNSVGLLVFWLLTSCVILSVVYITCRLMKIADFWDEAGKIIATFLPIALVFHISHYFTSLLINGQYLIEASSDPFGLGWDIFGLGHHWVTTSFMKSYSGQLAIWNFQTLIITIGHVAAIVLAYLVSGYGKSLKDNIIRHLPMTLLMVAYTVFGLWLLSSPTGA